MHAANWTACAGLVTSKDPLDILVLNDTAVEHPGDHKNLYK